MANFEALFEYMSETVLILLENKIFTIFFTVWMRGEYEELG